MSSDAVPCIVIWRLLLALMTAESAAGLVILTEGGAVSLSGYAGPLILIITINRDFHIPSFDVCKVISFWRYGCSAAISCIYSRIGSGVI